MHISCDVKYSPANRAVVCRTTSTSDATPRYESLTIPAEINTADGLIAFIMSKKPWLVHGYKLNDELRQRLDIALNNSKAQQVFEISSDYLEQIKRVAIKYMPSSMSAAQLKPIGYAARDEIKYVFQSLRKAGKTLRLNTNIYKGNLDTVDEMESFVRYFIGCCDTIKFSPLMATDMFDTVDSVTRYTKSVSIPDDDIRIIYDVFAQRHKKNREAHNVLGFVDYCELDVFNQNVLLKYAQVEDKYNRDTVIPTLKLYPNGTLSNEWDFKKNIEV